ncbi:hypothetical protein, partial [Streptosporangium sp. NPDC003464]
MKRDPRALMACAAVLGPYPPLVVTALWPLPWPFLALCALSYATEIAVRRRGRAEAESATYRNAAWDWW